MTLPAFREDDKYDGVDELAVGLKWMEKKGIVAREWTLNMDNNDYRFQGDHVLGLIVGDKEERCSSDYGTLLKVCRPELHLGYGFESDGRSILR